MKIGTNRQNLETELRKAIYEAGINSTIQNDIIDKIVEKGYERGFVSEIFEENILLETLSLTDLGVIILVLYNELKLYYINPEKFFTDIEIVELKKYKNEIKKETLEYPVVFEDVRQMADDIWTVIVDVKTIPKLYESNITNYNLEAQRQVKNIEFKNSIIKAPTVVWSAVEEIKDLLIKGLFIPNVITFNISKNTEFKFDKKFKRWILLKGKLDILDGFHRCLGIIAALREKDINYKFELRITNFDKDKARQLIKQEDKRNPISKEYIKSLDENDMVTSIINKLNQNSKSELRGFITTDFKIIATGHSLVRFDLMYNTIDKLWNFKTIRESDKVFEYLRDFFNEIVGLYPNEMKFYIKESRKRNYINNEKMFVLYLIIAKKLEGKDWKSKLPNIIKSINVNSDIFKEYINTPPSVIKNRFNNNFEIAKKIIEGVSINDK